MPGEAGVLGRMAAIPLQNSMKARSTAKPIRSDACAETGVLGDISRSISSYTASRSRCDCSWARARVTTLSLVERAAEEELEQADIAYLRLLGGGLAQPLLQSRPAPGRLIE